MSAVRDQVWARLIGNEERLEALKDRHGALTSELAEAERDLDAVRREVAAQADALREYGQSRLEWGDFSTRPMSRLWGEDRGRCIDRYYIEAFIESHATDIRGAVLEVHDSGYTRAFGGARVTRSDVVDIDAANKGATIVADLRRAVGVPSCTYDCIILTQTLQYIDDLIAALRECSRILKPEGVLLATMPSASRVAPEHGQDGDFWRFTEASARRLFERVFARDRLEVRAHGNVLANIAYLYGLACHEVLESELQAPDPDVPLVVTVRARK